MDLIILKQAKREIHDLPVGIIQDAFALFEDLMAGKSLSMPVSRPLPSIAKGSMSSGSQVKVENIESSM